MSPLGRSRIDRKNPSCGKFVILPIARCCCETAVESSETSSGLGMALRDTTGPIRTSDFDSSRLSRNAEDVPPHAPRNADPTPGKTAIQWGTDGVFRTTRSVLHGVFGTGHRVLHGVFRTTRAVLHGVFGTGQRVLNGVCARGLEAFPRIKDARLNASQRREPGSETYLFTKKGLLAFLEDLPR